MSWRASIAAVCAMHAGTAHAQCDKPEATRYVPLPVWATNPNSGTTWGAMLVLLRVCPADQHTSWIFAPSATWNSTIHATGTLRWFAYPDPDTTLTLIASASTHINYNAMAAWQRLPTTVGSWTDEAFARVQRDAFARFYGLGFDSLASGESTYTATDVIASERRGRQLSEHLNLGAMVGLSYVSIDGRGVPGLPVAKERYPDVPGMLTGSTVAWQGLELRYDDREGGDYAVSGIRLAASLSVVEGLAHSPTFLRGGVEGRLNVPETSWLSLATRVAYMAASSDEAPFYEQSELGGAYMLRGFSEGRFIASQAWTAELEQRIRVMRTQIFGVITDWRIDPFIATGQVFDDVGDAFAHPRVTYGAGLRVYVHPNILGRVDFAEGGEGLKIYVALGYPY